MDSSCSTEPVGESRRGYLAEFPPKRSHGVLIALCVAVFYCLGVTNQWWPTPDSALYQGLGRSLLRGEGYRFNGQVNSDVTPGMPVILAALRWAFGDGFLAPNVFVTLSGLASLFLIYLTFARLTNRRMALAVALGTAASYKYFHYSHLILTDAPFSALFWACTYASVRYLQGRRRWLLAAVALAVVAVVVRAPGLLVLGPMAVGLALHRNGPAGLPKRLLGGGAILGALGAVAGGLYLLARSVADTVPLYASGALASKGPLLRLQMLLRQVLAMPDELARALTAQPIAPVGAVLCALAVLGMVDLIRKGSRLSAVTCVLFVVSLGLLGGVRTRYMMAILPLFLFTMLDGVCWIVEWCHRLRSRPVRPAAFLVAVSASLFLLIAANVPKIVRDSVYYSYAAYTGQYYRVVREGHFIDLGPVTRLLRSRFDPGTPVAARTDRVSILHFLSERRMVRCLGTRRKAAAEADAVYRKLLTRADVQVIVADVSGEPEPFHRRLDELLSASGAPVLYEGAWCKVYDWSGASRSVPPGPRTGPSSRPRGGPAGGAARQVE